MAVRLCAMHLMPRGIKINTNTNNNKPAHITHPIRTGRFRFRRVAVWVTEWLRKVSLLCVLSMLCLLQSPGEGKVHWFVSMHGVGYIHEWPNVGGMRGLGSRALNLEFFQTLRLYAV